MGTLFRYRPSAATYLQVKELLVHSLDLHVDICWGRVEGAHAKRIPSTGRHVVEGVGPWCWLLWLRLLRCWGCSPWWGTGVKWRSTKQVDVSWNVKVVIFKGTARLRAMLFGLVYWGSCPSPLEASVETSQNEVNPRIPLYPRWFSSPQRQSV